MILHDITLYRVRLPLTTPYKVAYRVYNDFDPILVRLRDTNCNEGWGEGHISPGYSHETVENGWAFCCAAAARLAGMEVGAARQHLLPLIAGVCLQPWTIGRLLDLNRYNRQAMESLSGATRVLGPGFGFFAL